MGILKKGEFLDFFEKKGNISKFIHLKNHLNFQIFHNTCTIKPHDCEKFEN